MNDPTDPQRFDLASPIFVAHEGGKVSMAPTKRLDGPDDLSLLYTPGVAEVSLAVAQDPALAARFTARGNTVAVISDGTAVLGLGDIGPLGALPVMEGKAVLFKHFADIDAVAVVLETGNADELVEAIARIAPSYGGINLEDISAPRCFDIEERLKERLDIPVFHDDQHGTAIVVLAGLLNAVKILGTPLHELRVAVSGAGAAGVAVTNLLIRAGVRDIVVCDSRGVLSADRADVSGHKARLALATNPRGVTGGIAEALAGATVFVGVSGGSVPEEAVAGMDANSAIFALANPTPEIQPDVAARYARVVATGRSDYPNQVNNVLAFPGIFRGALDSGAAAITETMKLAAASAIADLVPEPTPDRIIPSPFMPGVSAAVAQAVSECASQDARRS